MINEKESQEESTKGKGEGSIISNDCQEQSTKKKKRFK